MRSAALARFSHSFRLELRLLAFNWWYPLVHVLWAVLLIVFFFQNQSNLTLLETLRYTRSSQAQLETTVGRFTIGMISLIALFTAGISASRARRNRFAGLEDSFPTGVEVPLSRCLATLVALLLFLVEPLVIAYIPGPRDSFLAGLPLFLLEASLTIAFTTALAWWLSSWLRMGRWSYPLLAGGWLAFMLGPTVLTMRFGGPAQLANYMRQGVSFYSEMWGRIVYAGLPLYFNLFYLGLLLVLLGLLVLTLVRRRFFRLSRLAGAVTLTGLGLAVFGGTSYLQLFEGQIRKMNQDAAAFSELSGERLQVRIYDIAINLADDSRPSFDVRMSVRNPGVQALDLLDFALMPSLEVTAASLPYQRQGASLRFELPEPLAPGARADVELSYRGEVKHVSYADNQPQLVDFVLPRGVRLSPQAAWYPRPVSGSGAGSFRVQVTGSDSLRFAANLPMTAKNVFEADGVSWVFLIGSPHLVTEQDGPVTLVTARNDLDAVRAHTALYRDYLGWIQPFFPGVPVDRAILMVLGEEPGMPDTTPPADGVAVVVSSPYTLNWLKEQDYGRYRLGYLPLFYDFWHMAGGAVREDNNLWINTVARFLWLYSRNGGDAQFMQAEFEDGTSGLRDGLMTVYQERGEEGLVAVLTKLVVESNQVMQRSEAEWQDWMVEASNAP
jgi:hypothetical protein